MHSIMNAEAAIHEANDGAPSFLRKGFVFHADDILNKKQWRSEWALADRLAMPRRMMSLPRRLKIPIAFGLIRRTSSSERVGKLSHSEFHHVMAFGQCIARADKHIREHCGPREIGSVIAENSDGRMRKFFHAAVDVWRDKPIVLPTGSVRPTLEKLDRGYVTQEDEFRVTRIRKSILFLQKNEDPLTQMADAVAFGLRRYHCGLEFGQDFAKSIFGPSPAPPLDDFLGPSSSGVYSWPST